MTESIRQRVKRARPRVVVTGVGAVTPLGNTVRETWEGLVAGRSGIGPITFFDASDLPTRIAGEIKGFDPMKLKRLHLILASLAYRLVIIILIAIPCWARS